MINDNQKELIPVFFSIDDKYACYLAAAMASLIENASPAYNYRLYIMNEGLNEENVKNIRAFERDGFEIIFADMHDAFSRMTEKQTNLLRCDYFTLTIYSRIFIAEMFPQYKKGIYLDSDIIVPGDISKLYEQNLHDNLIGACIDLSIQDARPLTDYANQAVGVDHAKYVNSGVLLLNMEKLREVDMAGRFVYLLNTYHFDSLAPDQDYINAMCYGKIEFLDNTWNVFPDENKPESENPMIVHYNLFAKPWLYKGIPYESYFWNYIQKTPYYEAALTERDTYTDAQKAKDAENMKCFAVRGAQIMENGQTFRSVFNTGKEPRL